MTRFRLKLAAVFCGVSALTFFILCHVAHADPVAAATAATDTGWSLVTQYGPLWAGAIIAMGIGQTFLKQQHWLAQGRTLALITGGVSTLGAVLAWKFSGAPVEGIVITAIMALKLAWSPNVAPVAKSSAGAAAALALVVLALAGPQLACSSAKSEAVAAGHAVVDCAKADAAQLEALLVELGEDAVASALHTGAVDWGALESRAEAAGVTIGGCALAMQVHAQPPAPSSGTSINAQATPPPAPNPARAALERLRSTFGGVRWQTASGVL